MCVNISSFQNVVVRIVSDIGFVKAVDIFVVEGRLRQQHSSPFKLTRSWVSPFFSSPLGFDHYYNRLRERKSKSVVFLPPFSLTVFPAGAIFRQTGLGELGVTAW